jgi:hypothetical protein
MQQAIEQADLVLTVTDGKVRIAKDRKGLSPLIGGRCSVSHARQLLTQSTGSPDGNPQWRAVAALESIAEKLDSAIDAIHGVGHDINNAVDRTCGG